MPFATERVVAVLRLYRTVTAKQGQGVSGCVVVVGARGAKMTTTKAPVFAGAFLIKMVVRHSFGVF